ncbi:hypothetical protein NGRA_0153 [Nosema granulosis]|uniref:Uncharacterized protein n=1 Tax=Nosema granulosis TaxID=83296 RepID=A0A9P6L0T6_9MICR|nr:hypothetical protein NGRA_0153 [Nosema granulosis]
MDIIEIINRKKRNQEYFYEDLIDLERNKGEGLQKIQILYMLGVDYKEFGEETKSLGILRECFREIIQFVYSTRFEKQDVEILNSTIQKVIIEISKRDRKPSRIIKNFYTNNDINENKIGDFVIKMIEDFKGIRKVLGKDTNEIFLFLLQTEIEECGEFITEEFQEELLIDTLKVSSEKIPFLIKYISKKSIKGMVFLLLFDRERYQENMQEIRKRLIVASKEERSETILEIITTTREDEYFFTIKESLKEWWDDSLEDTEDLVHSWFLTGQFKRIQEISRRVPISSKLLFIISNEEDRNVLGSDCGVLGSDCGVLGSNCNVLGSNCNVLGSNCGGSNCGVLGSNCEVLGSDWDLEEEYSKKKIIYLSRKKNLTVEIVRETINSNISSKTIILLLMLDLKEFKILKEIILREKISIFSRFLISFLHLKELEIEVEERLKILNGINLPKKLSPRDEDWISKVIYNNLVDVYSGSRVEDSIIQRSIRILISLSPTGSFLLISFLLIDDKDWLYSNTTGALYSSTTNTNTIRVLFYEYYLFNNPKRAREIFKTFRNLESDLLLYILGIPHCVDKTIVLESHFRGILTPHHLENILVHLMGPIPLYRYLKSLVVLNPKEYLTKKSQEILRINLKIVKNPEIIRFFQNFL